MPITEKVKKTIHSRAFLFRLIATLLVFICIPFLAMQILVISETTDEFQKNNQEHYLTLLQGSAHTFAQREELLSDTAYRMSQNEEIRKPMAHSAAENPLKDKLAADAICGYSAEMLHVDAVGVYYISKGYLLLNGTKMSNGIRYTLEEFCAKVEPPEEEQSEEQSEKQSDKERTEHALRLEAFFHNLTSFSYYAASDGELLIAARPVSLGIVGRNDAIAFFIMDAKALEESYRANISCQSSIAVQDETGAFLFKGEDFVSNLDEEALTRFLEGTENASIAGAQKQLLLYRYTDPQSGFVFLLAADRDDAQEQLLQFASTVRTTIFVMVAVLIISLLATIYITYRPIHRLLQKYGSSEKQHSGSEIEWLDSTLFQLDKETANQQELLTDFILGDLIFGNEVKPELLDRYFSGEHYRYFVVLTAICSTLTSSQSKKLEDSLKGAAHCNVYVTSVPSRPHTVIACLSADPIDPGALQYHCSCAVRDVVGVECPVCIGEVVGDVRALRRSYRSAVIVNMDPMKTEPGANAGELSKKLQSLSQCVYMGDEMEAMKHLEDIRKFLFAHTVGEGHLRYYGFKLLNAYLNSVNGNQAQLSGQEVELLLSFTNMDQLFKLLGESIHQVCGKVVDMEHIMDAQMQQRLLEYVDTHFQESELCLTAAADYIGTSIYAVSRLFKEITGKGFKDYVTEKRLEYGHTLLCSTNRSIAEISTAAGFENANYFSTIFKAKYGMPPTKYRNEQKDKQED